MSELTVHSIESKNTTKFNILKHVSDFYEIKETSMTMCTCTQRYTYLDHGADWRNTCNICISFNYTDLLSWISTAGLLMADDKLCEDIRKNANYMNTLVITTNKGNLTALRMNKS